MTWIIMILDQILGRLSEWHEEGEVRAGEVIGRIVGLYDDRGITIEVDGWSKPS